MFVASVTGHIRAFHLPYLEYFKNKGYNVEVASNGDAEIQGCDKRHQIEFQRSPLKKDNIKAYKALKKIISDGEYEIIHCHTPVAAMMTRLVARKARKKYKTKVIYTAHGFHFFKGAPFLNWLIYFPVEWLCSFFTDVLITINKEDFAFAQKHMHAKRVEYVPGVGVNADKLESAGKSRDEKRQELGIPLDSTVVLSVGELNENKNHKVILRAIANINRKDIVYVICGNGAGREYLEKLAEELGIRDRLVLAGHRTDLAEIYTCCDIFAFPSLREGLPVSLMEAMYCRLPVICSDIRGNIDLIDDKKGGFLFDPKSSDDVLSALYKLLKHSDWQGLGEYNFDKVRSFTLEAVNADMIKIYEEGIGVKG